MRPAAIAAAAALVIAVLAGWTLTRARQVPAAAADATVEAGVSRVLAAGRAARVSNLRYALSLDIPADRSRPIAGRIEATFDLRDAETALAFDFAQPPAHLTAAFAAGRRIEPRLAAGHLVLSPAQLSAGRNVVTFVFTAGDEALNRHDDFLYSLFVPSRASVAMPVFDQPDLKARWTLTLTLPADWQAVSNGRTSGRAATAGRARVSFDETRPIPPYLFAIAAGRFSVETAERDGRTLRMFHREPDAAKVARNRDAIFDLHARALAWMRTYTGIDYPFGKFDFVLLPSFQFGGMEHPGAVFYDADAVMLDASATQTQALNRANVISHETAHMWFGDLVTMTWFDDVWMKEVFANVFAARIVNPSFPTIDHPLRFFLQNYPAAYDIDRTDGANPIRQPLDNLSEAGSLYGPIIYQKAPIVMRQLEQLIGADALRDGLREYLTVNAFGNASWLDLVHVLDARTPLDLAAWSNAWVDQAGRPVITTELDTAGGTIAQLTLHQADPRQRGLAWPQRLTLLVAHGLVIDRLAVTLDGQTTVVPATAGLPAPDWVLPAGDGLGYGDFVLDPASLSSLARLAPGLPDPLTRAAALVTLWDAMLDGRLPVAAMRQTMLAGLSVETDELLRQWMLDQSRALFWRFTRDRDRPAFAATLEPILEDGLARAAGTSAKAAWFAALRAIATRPETLARLEAIWRRDVRVDGLPLAEADEIDLAFDLALRGVPDAGSILSAQLARITNPDRRARFTFILPAVSPDAAVRRRFFDSLSERANRAHEAWVVDAVRYLHHPLHAAASRALIAPALGLLREIQQTGDIFFPRRWTDATLSGDQTPEAASDVRAFIAALPDDYPPRLRWILLASADPLFRAAAIAR